MSSPTVDVRRQAGWLPAQEDLEDWLAGHRKRAEADQRPLHPALVELRELVDGDPVLRMHLNRMIDEVPHNRQYRRRHLESVPQLLRMINTVLTVAPEYGASAVTMPLQGILDWTMGTRAGFATYRDPRVNAVLRKVLDAWCAFLNGPDSRYVLNDSPSGWMCDAARRTIGIEQYRHDPDAAHWGYASWNDFFTRRFRDGARPVAAPDDDAVIVNACESTPYGLAVDVQRRDRFWVKGQPYSLQDLLAGDPSVDQFVGGVVYQAFLSAVNYHRWHSPVAGTIVRAFVVPGTYFSEADTEGDEAIEPAYSQGYLAHVATRAVILIQADNPAIGLVALVAVGMSDVSSCVLDERTRAGTHVAKGEEVGYFQFGGSTHCLVFCPGAIAEFAVTAVPQPHDPDASAVPVCSRLATANTSRD